MYLLGCLGPILAPWWVRFRSARLQSVRLRDSLQGSASGSRLWPLTPAHSAETGCLIREKGKWHESLTMFLYSHNISDDCMNVQVLLDYITYPEKLQLSFQFSVHLNMVPKYLGIPNDNICCTCPIAPCTLAIITCSWIVMNWQAFV